MPEISKDVTVDIDIDVVCNNCGVGLTATAMYNEVCVEPCVGCMDEAKDIARNAGYADGEAAGGKDGYDEGHDAGYAAGIDAGFAALQGSS